jgi:hypothetical protein
MTKTRAGVGATYTRSRTHAQARGSADKRCGIGSSYTGPEHVLSARSCASESEITPRRRRSWWRCRSTRSGPWRAEGGGGGGGTGGGTSRVAFIRDDENVSGRINAVSGAAPVKIVGAESARAARLMEIFRAAGTRGRSGRMGPTLSLRASGASRSILSVFVARRERWGWGLGRGIGCVGRGAGGGGGRGGEVGRRSNTAMGPNAVYVYMHTCVYIVDMLALAPGDDRMEGSACPPTSGCLPRPSIDRCDSVFSFLSLRDPKVCSFTG